MNTQTKTKHTPGLWHVVERPHNALLDGIVIGNGECAIAQTFGTGNKSEANARLIAAAPELLAACEFALRYHNMHLDKADGNELPFQLSDAIQNAIAKARGEA